MFRVVEHIEIAIVGYNMRFTGKKKYFVNVEHITGCAVQSARHLFQSNLTIWQPWFEYIGLNESSGKGFSISLPKSKKKCKVGWVQPFECKYWRWKNDSTLQACHFAPMFGISLRAWQMKAETVSFQWKKRESGYLLRGKSYGAFCGNIDSAFFSLHQNTLGFINRKWTKAFSGLDSLSSNGYNSTILWDIANYFFFFERRMPCLYFKAKSTIQCCQIRIWEEKNRRADCTADPV